jgi:hypothetical protein
LLHHLKTIKAGHIDVCDDQVRLLGSRQIQAFAAIACGDNQEPLSGKVEVNQFTHIEVVFNDKDFLRHR